MGMLDDLAGRAKGFLNTDKGEEVSDNVLDTAADKANDLTGGKFDDKIEQGKDAVDGAIGQ